MMLKGWSGAIDTLAGGFRAFWTQPARERFARLAAVKRDTLDGLFVTGPW